MNVGMCINMSGLGRSRHSWQNTFRTCSSSGTGTRRMRSMRGRTKVGEIRMVRLRVGRFCEDESKADAAARLGDKCRPGGSGMTAVMQAIGPLRVGGTHPAKLESELMGWGVKDRKSFPQTPGRIHGGPGREFGSPLAWALTSSVMGTGGSAKWS